MAGLHPTFLFLVATQREILDMSAQSSKKDLIQAIRFYVDKIVNDPTMGGE